MMKNRPSILYPLVRFLMACSVALAMGCGSDGQETGPDAGGRGPDAGSPGDGGDGTDGAAGGSDGGMDLPDGGNAGNLRFTSIICLPDTSNGQAVVEGQQIGCTFRVEGTTTGSVSLRCEDDAGAALDCGSSSTTQLQPSGSHPLPINDGWFYTRTDGLAGTTLVVIWVADGGNTQARHRFEAPVIADDGLNEPPSIAIDCAGDTDGRVRVTAGNQLGCTLRFLDPDPDVLVWSYQQTAGPAPASQPRPFGGAGSAPLTADWQWQTSTSEAGGSWMYTFHVDDGTAPPVTSDLVVTVE